VDSRVEYQRARRAAQAPKPVIGFIQLLANRLTHNRSTAKRLTPAKAYSVAAVALTATIATVLPPAVGALTASARDYTSEAYLAPTSFAPFASDTGGELPAAVEDIPDAELLIQSFYANGFYGDRELITDDPDSPEDELTAFIEAHAEFLDSNRPLGASRSASRTDLAEVLYESIESQQVDKFVAAAEIIGQAELYLMNEARTTPEVAEEIRIATEQLRIAITLANEAPPEQAEIFYELVLWNTERLSAALSEAQPSVAVAVPRELSVDEEIAELIATAQANAAELEATYGDIHTRYENGRLPNHALAPLSWASGQMLRPDAAAQFELLNAAYRLQFNTDLVVLDSYRTYERQLVMRATGRGAVPGASEHGWGLAVDLGGGVNRFGTSQHQWLRENAHYFGWILPEWAQERGSKPEPWHWEFVGPDAIQG